MQRGVGPCMRRNGLQTPKTRLLPPSDAGLRLSPTQPCQQGPKSGPGTGYPGNWDGTQLARQTSGFLRVNK